MFNAKSLLNYVMQKVTLAQYKLKGLSFILTIDSAASQVSEVHRTQE